MTAIGRLDRLASLFEVKLQAIAIHSSQLTKEALLRDAAQKIKDVYHSYLISRDESIKLRLPSKKFDSIFVWLAEQGDLFSKHLIEDMRYLVSRIDALITEPDQDDLLLLLATIRKDISDNRDPVRSALHDAFPVGMLRQRKEKLTQFENVIARVERAIVEVSDVVKEFCTPETLLLTEDVLSGKARPPKIGDTLPRELEDFLKTPDADKYGIKNKDILAKMLTMPGIRAKITGLINAIKRGHVPRNGPAVLKASTEAVKQLAEEARLKGPSPIHDMSEEQAQRAYNFKADPGEQWSEEMNRSKKEKGQEEEEFPGMEPEKLEQEITNRDFLHQQSELLRKRQQEEQQKKEWEEKMISKYNSASLYEFLRKV